MKNKKLFKVILIIVLAVVIVGGVVGGIYYYKTLKTKKQTTDTIVKEQEQVIENKSNSTRTSIDDKWDIYTNYKLGFSIEIPKESVMDNISGSKAPVEVIEPTKWPNTIHIVASTQENIKWHQDKINNANNELESVQYVPFGILIRENINNDEDIKKFIQERYGEKCGILEREDTSQKGVFDIRIAGSSSIGSEGSCAIMWRYALKYDSNSKKLASWDGGQDYGFRTENTINGVDDEMNDSFRFIELTSKEENLSKETPSSIADDESIITSFDVASVCEEMGLRWKFINQPDVNMDEYYKTVREFIPLTKINNSSNLYAKVRSSIEGQDKNIIGISGWSDDNGYLKVLGSHILEFYTKEGDNFNLAPIPPINGYECDFPGTFKIYYYNPNMIIAVIGGGHESIPSNFYFDGIKWNDMYDLVRERLNLGETQQPYFAPFKLRANKNYFSLMEFKYCCDGTYWMNQEKKTEIIFDTQTRSIINKILYNQ